MTNNEYLPERRRFLYGKFREFMAWAHFPGKDIKMEEFEFTFPASSMLEAGRDLYNLALDISLDDCHVWQGHMKTIRGKLKSDGTIVYTAVVSLRRDPEKTRCGGRSENFSSVDEESDEE